MVMNSWICCYEVYLLSDIYYNYHFRICTNHLHPAWFFQSEGLLLISRHFLCLCLCSHLMPCSSSIQTKTCSHPLWQFSGSSNLHPTDYIKSTGASTEDKQKKQVLGIRQDFNHRLKPAVKLWPCCFFQYEISSLWNFTQNLNYAVPCTVQMP